jgi:excisionase family DNA binding protein
MTTKYARIKEVAEYTHLKERTIRSYVLRKEIPYLKVKGCLVFNLEDIDAWMKNHSIKPADTNSILRGYNNDK